MTNDLFGLVSRDERQAQCLKKWKESGGRATIIAATGFGKTRIATNLIQKFVNNNSSFKVLVAVPTITLKEQWTGIIDCLGLSLNVEVEVINTIVKHEWKVNLLVIDEAHRAASTTLIKVFDVVKYRYILGLTATIERLDGKHELLKKYCPVCDEVTLELALLNGWVSPYKEYEVIIDIDDIDVYQDLQHKFTAEFEFFNYNFPLIMDKENGLLGKNGLKNRIKLRDEMCPSNGRNEQQRKDVLRDITLHATTFSRVMQERKKFINNHPKKLEIARKIIEARPNAKIITFSNSIAMAEKIGIGKVYSGKESKKVSRGTMDEFIRGDFNILNTISKVNEGLDVPGLSVAIQLGTDSSAIKALQRLGRCIRKEAGKKAEMFTIIINDTQELKWYSNSHTKQTNFIPIDEKGLDDVLNGIEPTPYVRPLKQFTFRY